MIVILAILMVVLFTASAFFSSSETALFSVNSTTLQGWKETGTPAQQLTGRLMDDHHSTITTILLGNNFVNILTAVVLSRLLVSLFPARNADFIKVISVLVNTCLLLALGEVTPKAIAYSMANRHAPRVAPVIHLLRTILRPLVALLKGVSGLILKALRADDKSNAISIEEYQTFTRMAHRMGVFNAAEVEMFDRVFALRETHVGRFMIPRPDVGTVDISMSPAEVSEAVREHCHRFLPAVDGDLDDVKGILDVTKFALLAEAEKKNWPACCLLPPLFIPENGRTHAVLAELKQAQQGIAFAVNEYGGIEGLITAEDIYEQMVGDLEDEFDQPAWYITEVSKDHWRLSGMIPLQQVEKHFGISFADTSVETVAGLLAEKLEHIPDTDESCTWEGHRFVVRQTHRNRVLEVDVFKTGDKR